jgi:hypothetical protein
MEKEIFYTEFYEAEQCLLLRGGIVQSVPRNCDHFLT